MFYDIEVSPPKLYYNLRVQATGVFYIFTVPNMMLCIKKALEKFAAYLSNTSLNSVKTVWCAAL